MLSPLSLMNMEMQLYGGTSFNSTAPSYSNNYYLQSNYLNPYYGAYNPSFYGYNNQSFYGYPNNNAIFGQNIPQGYVQAAQTQQQGLSQQAPQQLPATPFEGLTKAESEAIVDFYAKNLEPSQSLTAAATSGVAVGALMMNPRILAHPINYLTTSFSKKSRVNKLFDLKKNSALKEAWKSNNIILEEAYSQMHRAEARSKWKIGAFRKRYTPEEFSKLENIMKEALKPGADGKIDIKKVANATEQLRHAYTTNGWLAIGKNATVETQLAEVTEKATANGKAVRDNTARLLKFRNQKMTFKNAFKKAGGKLGLAFAAVEVVMNMGKIQTAFQVDKKTGYKQLGQTSVKAVANAGGWVLGEAAGIWASAKLGAAIGTAFGPGIGTAVGAVAGLLGGSIGMWLCGKAAKKIVGEDVANKIEAKNLAKTEEGQLTLVQNAMQGIQSGQQVSQPAQQGVQKILAMYA